MSKDKYTYEILLEHFYIHQQYILNIKNISKKIGIKMRTPNFPEQISENIIKFIIQKQFDKNITWICKGDLKSDIYGKIECKCFSSSGPTSFGPTENWNIIFFLDMTEWLKNKIVLYKVNLQNTSKEWKNIKVNKKETFEQQCVNKRRPRINWKNLYPQIKDYCEIIFTGKLEDIK